MSHYDDVRDAIEAREDEEAFKSTGLYLHEQHQMIYLQKQVDAYDDFMNIEVKRKKLQELKDKRLHKEDT